MLHFTVTCEPGYESQDGTACVKCPPGKFKTTKGTEPCQSCPMTADAPPKPQITPADGATDPNLCQGNNQIYL